ncbi:MAG: type II toxin-antitoxin system RelE/ParE family toxin [Candidatus Gracilibacteria bacterium]|jgi:mRNA-degrading endonuclease RelE of RelBE toxin-antitoxin system
MKIFFSEHFKKQLKKLKKKYPHVKDDFLNIIESFNTNNEISIGRSIYKIRIASTDMQKGKSGGFRSYLYVYVKNNLLLPLCIYPKSETESITENELKYHFDQTIEEVIGAM